MVNLYQCGLKVMRFQTPEEVETIKESTRKPSVEEADVDESSDGYSSDESECNLCHSDSKYSKDDDCDYKSFIPKTLFQTYITFIYVDRQTLCNGWHSYLFYLQDVSLFSREITDKKRTAFIIVLDNSFHLL